MHPRAARRPCKGCICTRISARPLNTNIRTRERASERAPICRPYLVHKSLSQGAATERKHTTRSPENAIYMIIRIVTVHQNFRPGSPNCCCCGRPRCPRVRRFHRVATTDAINGFSRQKERQRQTRQRETERDREKQRKEEATVFIVIVWLR